MRRRFSTDDILMEDEEILVVRKHAGMAVQSARPGQMDLEHELYNYLAQEQPAGGRRLPYLAVIHRLDQPVQGILVFGKTPKAAAKLNQALQADRMQKYYLAVVEGKPEYTKGTLIDYLKKDGKRNMSEVTEKNSPGAKRAELSYRILETVRDQESGAARSLLQIKLKTGRHHQIRVQMAHAGMPLCGDSKYSPLIEERQNGAKVSEREDGLALCAYRLALPHPRTGQVLEFQVSPEGKLFQGFCVPKVRKKS